MPPFRKEWGILSLEVWAFFCFLAFVNTASDGGGLVGARNLSAVFFMVFKVINTEVRWCQLHR